MSEPHFRFQGYRTGWFYGFLILCLVHLVCNFIYIVTFIDVGKESTLRDIINFVIVFFWPALLLLHIWIFRARTLTSFVIFVEVLQLMYWTYSLVKDSKSKSFLMFLLAIALTWLPSIYGIQLGRHGRFLVRVSDAQLEADVALPEYTDDPIEEGNEMPPEEFGPLMDAYRLQERTFDERAGTTTNFAGPSRSRDSHSTYTNSHRAFSGLSTNVQMRTRHQSRYVDDEMAVSDGSIDGLQEIPHALSSSTTSRSWFIRVKRAFVARPTNSIPDRPIPLVTFSQNNPYISSNDRSITNQDDVVLGMEDIDAPLLVPAKHHINIHWSITLHPVLTIETHLVLLQWNSIVDLGFVIYDMFKVSGSRRFLLMACFMHLTTLTYLIAVVHGLVQLRMSSWIVSRSPNIVFALLSGSATFLGITQSAMIESQLLLESPKLNVALVVVVLIRLLLGMACWSFTLELHRQHLRVPDNPFLVDDAGNVKIVHWAR